MGGWILLYLYGYLWCPYVELLCIQDSFFSLHILYHHSKIHNVVTCQDRLILRGRDGVLECQNCRERKGCGEKKAKQSDGANDSQCMF